jgi:hypothetical protein
MMEGMLGMIEHALIRSGSAYPPSSSSTISSSTIQIQALPQPATVVSVKNNSVDGSSSRNAAVAKKKPKLRSGVILKPSKDGRAYSYML